MPSHRVENMPEIERLFKAAPFIRDLGMELGGHCTGAFARQCFR